MKEMTLVMGICSVKRKKVHSSPMKSILERLQHPNIEIVVFSESVILNDPIEDWPICDCLIAFFSVGFPLGKAVKYAKLRKPLLINDLESQYDLLDRRIIYKKLKEAGVPVPEYAVLSRNEDGITDSTWDEQEDVLTIGSQVFPKPFVEKPVSAEDHNVHIYFPSAVGGGSQQLFRKINDRSSKYSGENAVRRTGSYIYEKFLATDGTDVKVYTVGPDYAHAEARKSPGLDGKVQRDKSGKEKRFPVILSAHEKLIARQVCNAFKQTICGFDLLRDGGNSYVCDVNGFSFVKNSPKYYDDCAQILKEMIFSELAPELFPSIKPSVEYLAEEIPVPIPSSDPQLELRCVIAIIRHGDRTPKQKMKMVVTHERFLKLYEKYDVKKKLKIKLKSPGELQEVLDIANGLLEEVETNPAAFGDTTELVRKLKQTKSVLEMYGYFSGINRKVQLKYIKSPDPGQERALLMILKWGGELTPAGRQQAEELGKVFRCIYPGGAGEYGSLPGSGFLRLHSTYRHDLKVYGSDEGRVQMTAAAFVKGLLDLEGSLPPILFHLVKRDNKLLDNAFMAEEAMTRAKKRLHEYMRTNTCDIEELRRKLSPTGATSYQVAIDAIKNPVVACQMMYDNIVLLIKQISDLEADGKEVKLYLSEGLKLMLARWSKLEKDFKHKDGKFDISKIPDIYDCIKYDMLHNSHLGLKVAYDLYIQSMHLADLVMPQEYGITRDEKIEIAGTVCQPLLHKIQTDITHTVSNIGTDIMHQLDPKYSSGVVTPKRHVRTRLYFTSESNIHAMVNMLRFGSLSHLDHPEWKDAKKLLDSAPELNYMTQIVFLLFENSRAPVDSEERYKVEVHYSPGAKGREEIIASGESASCLGLDYKKTIIPLKRMLPDEDSTKVFTRKGSTTFTVPTVPAIDPVKRSAKSLPSLMSQEQLQTIKQVASKDSFFDVEEENVNNQQTLDSSTNTTEDTTTPSIVVSEPSQPPSGSELPNVTEEQLVDLDLATSVKPLQRLCTISLAEMEKFLSNDEVRFEHRSSVGSRRSSVTSHRSSTGSMI
ncbi:inositol hexakisphosphate and diphosphoinositol-pentakisphosphate kinase 2-like isoform X2 [Dysidea avara]|uniref:inositol hexakisphosphate and diphosphoinositol-pentakisphosphate kinase 2-like isoform X2 n=1 Tax=Dysidea avara TaxID=196820 RepID=UPI00332725CD